MAPSDLHEKYTKRVCCKLLCPISDCTEVEIEQQPEHLAAVLKPHKCSIYCLPFPCIGCCCGICCHTIDVHSLDKQGNLRISRHGICSTQEETHEDIVSMGLNLGLPQMFGARRSHAPAFEYFRSDGTTIPLTAGNCAPEVNRVHEKQKLSGIINEFLKERRTDVGQATNPNEQVQTLLSQLGGAQFGAAQLRAAQLGGAQFGGAHQGVGAAQQGGIHQALAMQLISQSRNQQPAGQASAPQMNDAGGIDMRTFANASVPVVSSSTTSPTPGAAAESSIPHGNIYHSVESARDYADNSQSLPSSTPCMPDEPPPSYQI
eukprot:gb/GECG01010342.1/.p1 GENE.gb/GECG01010342.1/~~gb/GECG01010342.1/.p1  ORF type:complete len:318 (+),score=25.71 gb/GECG01010342.1/:1-954(+)